MPLLVRYRMLLAAGLIAALVSGCGDRSVPPVVKVDQEAVKSVAGASNTFAFDVYEAIRDREGNLFFSPASISTALAMTSAGAGGETKEEMLAVLHLAEVKQPHAGFSALLALLNSRGERNGYLLSTANRLWGAESYPFKDEFLKLTRRRYRAELESLDFSDPEQARAIINEWVAEQTHDKITELIDSGTLNERTRLVLTNAIYFKGGWDEEFDKEDTKPEPFYLSTTRRAGGVRTKANNTVDVPMMHQQDSFHYTEDEFVQVLELRYRTGDLSMVIVLPKEKDGLAAVEETLAPSIFDGWIKEMDDYELVKVYLPKFKLRSRLSLVNTLKYLGMSSAFESQKANFAGISSENGLFLSKVVHEAFVDVDEKGTEAAAATGVADTAAAAIAIDSDPPEPIIFRADHPFLFVIRDNRSGVILFIGRVTDPRD